MPPITLSAPMGGPQFRRSVPCRSFHANPGGFLRNNAFSGFAAGYPSSLPPFLTPMKRTADCRYTKLLPLHRLLKLVWRLETLMPQASIVLFGNPQVFFPHTPQPSVSNAYGSAPPSNQPNFVSSDEGAMVPLHTRPFLSFEFICLF